MPERIQRRRTKGWGLPVEVVYVGRPTRWGNPYVIGADMSIGSTWFDGQRDETTIPMTRENAVAAYRSLILGRITPDPNGDEDLEDRLYVEKWVRWLEQLRGRDLACWCPLDQPCHADVLLELANRSE